MSAAERLFDGDLLRADVFAPGRDRLFVSFRHRIGQPGAFDAPQPVRSFLRDGYSHLHLQARWNDWYVNPETEAFESVLSAFSRGFGTRVSMGFSMGGYAALRFAQALRLDRAVVISPQVSIAREVVPFDRRYRAEARGFDPVKGDLARRSTAMHGAILIDPFKRRDLLHAQRIAALFPRMQIVRLGCGGHPATRALRQGGRFDWLKRELAQGLEDPARIGRMHRRVRRRSESYWRHLSDLADAHGRAALAAEAQRRADALARP